MSARSSFDVTPEVSAAIRVKRGMARRLRANLTPAEIKLWSALKGKGLGAKFYRQRAKSGYILDFYCASRRLIIEVDGGYHTTREQDAHDAERDARFAKAGYRTLRITNDLVLNAFQSALGLIREVMADQEIAVAKWRAEHPTVREGLMATVGTYRCPELSCLRPLVRRRKGGKPVYLWCAYCRLALPDPEREKLLNEGMPLLPGFETEDRC